MRPDPSTPLGESETLLTGTDTVPASADPERHLPPAPPRTPAQERGFLRRGADGLRRFPFVMLLLYYLVLAGVVALLVTYVPRAREALVEPAVLPNISRHGGEVLSATRVEGVTSVEPVLYATLDRAVATILVILGTLSLVIPVAWVYMRTKRFQYDPALVRSVIILPIVVAGIAVVVKNSLALAFSLAGIVAAVRFRSNLKDPRDAVYVFLVIGIGLSAGVQALDVALVMSLAFNLVVLYLWKYNIGSIYGGQYGRTGILSVGDPLLLVAQTPPEQREIRRHLLESADEIRSDGILLVHSTDPEVARQAVQEALGDMGRDWVLADIVDRGSGIATLEYVLRLKAEVTPVDLVGALDERWSTPVAAAEYIPFRTRQKRRKGSGKSKKKKDKDK